MHTIFHHQFSQAKYVYHIKYIMKMSASDDGGGDVGNTYYVHAFVNLIY